MCYRVCQTVTPFSLGFRVATVVFPLLSGLFIRTADLFSLGQPGLARRDGTGSSSVAGEREAGEGALTGNSWDGRMGEWDTDGEQCGGITSDEGRRVPAG